MYYRYVLRDSEILAAARDNNWPIDSIVGDYTCLNEAWLRRLTPFARGYALNRV
jgi:hypothetical protein